MPETKNKTNDKEEVRKVIEGFFSALSKKDIKGMMSFYSPEVVVFDCKPPMQTRGAVAWKHAWEACLPYFPDDFKVETRDLTIISGGTMAVAHHMFRITGPEKDHDAMQTWLRATTALKLQQGKWKIVHEHCSLPYDPHTLKVQFSLNPE
jgi:ketosteroid isomerase-like protein